MNKSYEEGNARGVVIAVAAVLAVLLFAGGGTIYAADASAPGDPLFGVDKAIENVQRSLTTDPVSEADLELDILDERMEELEEAEGAVEEAEGTEDTEDDQEAEDDFDAAVEEVEEQEDMVDEEMEEFEDAVENDEVDETSKARIIERITVQVENHTELMTRLQEKMADKGNSNAADALMKAAQNYEDNRDRNMENLQRVGEAKENKENQGNNDNSDKTPPGQEKKESDDTEEE